MCKRVDYSSINAVECMKATSVFVDILLPHCAQCKLYIYTYRLIALTYNFMAESVEEDIRRTIGFS